MLESEVTEAGEVIVEGQALGRLQGFRFTPEAGVSGAEARAMSAAAMKALASEIEARAGKLAAAPDEAFALALDGAIRWLGEPVAKLQAGEKVLEPRFIILADEQLTGGARESVEARLALWLRAHVQKLLGPLLTLETGEGLDGIGRGIAYQIAEHLGVLDRSIVQNDVKTLPQDARGALRKLGVRFGAYHLSVPALLKPAPRALAAQLWALKHGGVEVQGLDDLAHLAASGRTSIPVDEAIPKALYRAAGFRACGPRAIRVDILERLADLIRPAIAFRPGQTPGEPPPGAFMGDAFTVTGAMTSLAGCSGEDFAAVLKALGYRMEKRPPMKDVPVIPVVVSAAEPVAAAAGVAAERPEAEGEAAAEAPAESPVEAAEPVAAPEAASIEPPPPAEEPAVEAASPEREAGTAETPAPEAAAAPADAAAVAAEPELVEVWRPARFDREQRPNQRNAGERGGDRRGPRRPFRKPDAPADGSSAPAEAPPQGQGGGKPWRKRDRPQDGGERRFEGRRDDRKPDGRRDERKEGRKDERRDGRPGEGRGDRPRFNDRKPAAFSTEKPRDRQPDPNSPFAQLAALKAQLEAKK